jgi:hypothetical protein
LYKIWGNPSWTNNTPVARRNKTKGNLKAVAIKILGWKKGGTQLISQLTDVFVGPLGIENELNLGHFNDIESKCVNVKFIINFLIVNSNIIIKKSLRTINKNKMEQ